MKVTKLSRFWFKAEYKNKVGFGTSFSIAARTAFKLTQKPTKTI
jgi:hypothetical protein